MRRSKFNEIQIVAILRKVNSGTSVADICYENGIKLTTYYKWELQYAGLDVFETKKAKELEAECRLLKLTNAELVGQNEILKSLIEKEMSK